MNLQPLYDVKARLEQAAIAGTGLLAEDFRLTRAEEAFKPMAAASPVFAKIDAGLQKLLAAPPQERSGLLLDLLALVDAVAYTQGSVGLEGELSPLPQGGGVYRQISYGQIQPLLTALTTTGGGRMEIIQSAWDNHPEFFEDYRVLPAVAAGLGDSYGEIAELNARLLKKLGPSVVPVLKKDFDPAGKKEMARRVEVISALEGAGATPWLREVLPDAKKDVRIAVILALGNDPANTALLLDLARSERSGGNREAALQALAKQDGDAVREFWPAELKKNSGSVRFLRDTDTEWAGALIASGLREQLEGMLAHGGRVPAEEQTELSNWCQAVGRKDSPAMLDLWRWADGHMEEFDKFTNEKGNPVFAGVRLTDTLLDCLRHTGPGPLRDWCLELFDRRPEMTRYLHISFLAALLSLPAAEVYEKYSSYIVTIKPLLGAEKKETLNNVLLRALSELAWNREQGCHILAGRQPTAQPLDRRWIGRMVHAIWKNVPHTGNGYYNIQFIYWEKVDKFDMALMRLADPQDEETRKVLIPYLRQRLKETHQPYTYSCWLFRLGGSPRDILGDAMVMDPKANRTGTIWQLMNEAAKALPTEEVVALLGEILDSKCVYIHSRPAVEKAIPWTIEQLLAGKPFPTMDEWTRMQ